MKSGLFWSVPPKQWKCGFIGRGSNCGNDWRRRWRYPDLGAPASLPVIQDRGARRQGCRRSQEKNIEGFGRLWRIIGATNNKIMKKLKNVTAAMLAISFLTLRAINGLQAFSRRQFGHA